MIAWLQLTNEQRKAAIDAAEQQSGITAKVIEKDWWVTLVLRALFQSQYRDYIVFKGGTSLSKGWNLIQRFSEDIDLALAPEVFNMQYEEKPTGSRVRQLKRKGCEFTSNQLRQSLINELQRLGLSENLVIVEAAPVPEDRPDTDPQVLTVSYPSLYPQNDYIRDEAKIEVSVRSLRIPFRSVIMQSLLYAINPNPAYAETLFEVNTVEPRKTFLEKAFLLHEEFEQPDKTKIRSHRMSRHLYDLHKISETQIATEALLDHELYNGLIEHRKNYNKLPWVDYETHHHSQISFIPSNEIIEDYRKDYKDMQEQMIYEEAVNFDELIAQLKILQARFRLKMEHIPLEEIIEKAVRHLEGTHFVNGGYYSTAVVYTSDISQPPSERNKNVIFNLAFSYLNDSLIFQEIVVQNQ